MTERERPELDLAVNAFSNLFARRSTADTHHPSFITYCFRARGSAGTYDKAMVTRLTAMFMAALNMAANSTTEFKHIIWRMWPKLTFEDDGRYEICCRVSME